LKGRRHPRDDEVEQDDGDEHHVQRHDAHAHVLVLVVVEAFEVVVAQRGGEECQERGRGALKFGAVGEEAVEGDAEAQDAHQKHEEEGAQVLQRGSGWTRAHVKQVHALSHI
jgi:hypothetical protein